MSEGILQRLPDSRFSEVLPLWAGATVVLIGGGPSLSVQQVALVKAAHEAQKARCIAINDAYLWAPWAEVCYFADSRWWEWQTTGVAKPLLGLSAEQVRERFIAFAGQKCSIQHSGDNIHDEAVHILRNKRGQGNHGEGLSRDPTAIMTGKNSGWQALNLAVLAGATTVILLGFDAQPDARGREHWFGAHPSPTPAAFWAEMRRAFSAGENDLKAAGVRVLNCSPGSALDNFTKMGLEEALE